MTEATRPYFDRPGFRWTVAAVALLGALLVFTLDTRTPLGFAHGLLYPPLILLAGLIRLRRLVVAVTALCLLLNAAGAFTSPPAPEGISHIVALGNRVFSTLLIFLTGLLTALLLSQRQRHEESGRRFERLADAMPQLIWAANADGVLTYFNRATDDYTGDPDITIPLSENWLRALHPDDRERCMTRWMASVDSGEDYHIEFRIRRHDGVYRWHVTSAKPVRSADGRIAHWYGTCLDVEDIKRLEADLRQTQRLESLGQLTGGIAHDFNNLLTVILGNSELLQDELRDQPRLLEQARMAHRAASRGADLTQRLLAFSRRQSLEPRRVDVNQLLVDAGTLLQRAVGKHIRLAVEPVANLWPARVDPGQLESSLLNLALNARDAMPTGGSLTIESRNRRVTNGLARSETDTDIPAGDYVCVSVSDTGTGIAADHLARVIEPFFSTKERDKGTGLGLSMVYGFVKQSEGHLLIHSLPGQGTTVELYLPRARGGDGDGDGMVATDPGALESREPGGRGELILLVEDDELVRDFAEQTLSGLGYRVLAADSGSQALEILKGPEPVDLLFTDIVMPGGMDGYELARRVRREHPELAVVFTSGHTEYTQVGGRDLGRIGVLLHKPYERASLARCLDQALRSNLKEVGS